MAGAAAAHRPRLHARRPRDDDREHPQLRRLRRGRAARQRATPRLGHSRHPRLHHRLEPLRDRPLRRPRPDRPGLAQAPQAGRCRRDDIPRAPVRGRWRQDIHPGLGRRLHDAHDWLFARRHHRLLPRLRAASAVASRLAVPRRRHFHRHAEPRRWLTQPPRARRQHRGRTRHSLRHTTRRRGALGSGARTARAAHTRRTTLHQRAGAHEPGLSQLRGATGPLRGRRHQS